MKVLAAAAGVLGLVLAAGTPAGAQDKCAGGKLKAAGKALQGGIKCDAKAQAKATAGGGAACEAKPDGKLATAFTKADAKGPCGGTAGAVASANETCETNVIAAVGNNDATPTASKCDSKKSAAMGKKASAKLSCLSKQASKGTDPTACLAAAEGKFSAAIGKLSAATDCSNASTAGTLETVVNNCVSAVSALISSGTTTTTIGGGTTTTTLGGGFTKLKVTTLLGTASCGGAGLNPNPASPFSGRVDSDTAGTTKILDLGLGCLYIGGGAATIVPPDRIPDGASTIFAASGGTLTPSAGTGFTDCTNGAGPGKHCINDGPNNQCTAVTTPYPCCTGAGTGTCPRSCTTDANCPGSGTAGACQKDANCFFGPPLNIPNPTLKNLSTCVLNVIEANASGTVNQVTGDSSVSLPLFSVVHVTGNATFPCPKCVTGTCNAGPNVGKACTGVGAQATTFDCPPDPTKQIGSLPVTINPLTTGTASRTASDGLFCKLHTDCTALNTPYLCCTGAGAGAGCDQSTSGAFGVATANCVLAGNPFACCTGPGTGTCDAHRIAQTGAAGGDLTDGLGHNAKEGAVFCIPPTGNAGIDGAADIPGPGTIGLNTTAQLLP